MIYEKKTLQEWMKYAWMPNVAGAEKYRIGQKLTEAQAKDIMRIVAKSMEFSLDSTRARQKTFTNGDPYYDFIGAYLLLMFQAGPYDMSNWKRNLWNALSPWDQKTLAQFAKSKYGLDAQRLLA